LAGEARSARTACIQSRGAAGHSTRGAGTQTRGAHTRRLRTTTWGTAHAQRGGARRRRPPSRRRRCRGQQRAHWACSSGAGAGHTHAVGPGGEEALSAVAAHHAAVLLPDGEALQLLAHAQRRRARRVCVSTRPGPSPHPPQPRQGALRAHSMPSPVWLPAVFPATARFAARTGVLLPDNTLLPRAPAAPPGLHAQTRPNARRRRGACRRATAATCRAHRCAYD